MSLVVLKPGLLSTIQDLGRHGLQHLGVPVGGAMDSRAHRLANLLVGNDENEATLEITFGGPTLRFDATACIAITGARLAPTLNGQAIANNRPLVVRQGDILAFGQREAGLRAYLAWHGGLSLAPVLGSRSTNLRAGLGGIEGRALRKGDVLHLNKPLPAQDLDELAGRLWDLRIYLPRALVAQPRPALRMIMGAHVPLFSEEALANLFSEPFRVSPDSDRMGYRLRGPRLALSEPVQLLSEAATFGSVQVPADGQPIILMADRQTTGGYAKIGHIASVDLPLVAQSVPGDSLRFSEIPLARAQQLDMLRETAFTQLYESLAPLRTLLGR